MKNINNHHHNIHYLNFILIKVRNYKKLILTLNKIGFLFFNLDQIFFKLILMRIDLLIFLFHKKNYKIFISVKE